jgi:hypothetical protein
MTQQEQPTYYIFRATDVKTDKPHWYRINSTHDHKAIELSSAVITNDHLEWTKPSIYNETLSSWCNYNFIRYNPTKHDQMIVKEIES